MTAPNPEAPAWLSFHIYAHDVHQHFDLLRDCCLPLLTVVRSAGLLNSWFYIRYWEGSPHIRLRLLGAVDELRRIVQPGLIQAVASFVDRHPMGLRLDSHTYYVGFERELQGRDSSLLPWYEHGSVVESIYEPETIRYGGAMALPVSEQLFNASSEFATHVLLAVGASRSRLLAVASEIMLMTVMGFGIGPRDFFLDYRTSWQTFRAEQANAVSANHTYQIQRTALVHQLRSFPSRLEGEPYRTWLLHLAKAHGILSRLFGHGSSNRGTVDVSSALRAICASHVHMTNNRLGIMVNTEIYLASLLHDALHEVDIGGTH